MPPWGSGTGAGAAQAASGSRSETTLDAVRIVIDVEKSSFCSNWWVVLCLWLYESAITGRILGVLMYPVREADSYPRVPRLTLHRCIVDLDPHGSEEKGFPPARHRTLVGH